MIDESGAIATIATILASNRISIKNIGILHNREFQEGVLRIEFYERDAVEKPLPFCPSIHTSFIRVKQDEIRFAKFTRCLNIRQGHMQEWTLPNYSCR